MRRDYQLGTLGDLGWVGCADAEMGERRAVDLLWGRGGDAVHGEEVRREGFGGVPGR
jgi:hypothetical protein